MNLGLMFASVIVVATMALLSVKTHGTPRLALRAGAVSASWALAWTLALGTEAGTDGDPIWFYFYVALMVSGFFLAAAFVTILLWRWSGPGGSIVKGLFRVAAGVIVTCLLYAFVAAPLAWALFDRCLFPTVEHEGACAYKPD